MPVSDSSSSRRLEDQLKLALARIDLLEQPVTALESERAESAFEIVSEAASVVLPVETSVVAQRFILFFPNSCFSNCIFIAPRQTIDSRSDWCVDSLVP